MKAPTYKMVEENSKYADSYFYSIEPGTQSKKSLYYTMFLGYNSLPFYANVGTMYNILITRYSTMVIVITRNYPLRGYILHVLMHITAWD